MIPGDKSWVPGEVSERDLIKVGLDDIRTGGCAEL